MDLWKEKLLAIKDKKWKNKTGEKSPVYHLDHLIIVEFGSFFNSYVQAYNKKYRRYGSLLKESFNRKIVRSDSHLLKLICYVHNNPVTHGFTPRRENWKHSSYRLILNQQISFVPVSEIMELFNGKENYIFLHDRFLNHGYIN